MSHEWDSLSAADLVAIAEAIRARRLAVRPTALALQRYVRSDVSDGLAAALSELDVAPESLALFLDLLGRERGRADACVGAIELVWTGPEVPGLAGRETGAVVRELFASARRSVLIAGYAIHRGTEVFRVLAEHMDRDPSLDVRLVVDIRRVASDTTLAADLIQRFADDFRRRQWPGQRMPQVYYDPRSLAIEQAERSAMHAKCVAVDEAIALVTSANFTTAAQTKNIEVGALLRAPDYARRVTAYFDSLIRKGVLCELWTPLGPPEVPL